MIANFRIIETPDYFLAISDIAITTGSYYIDDTDSIRQAIISDEDYWSRRKDYKRISLYRSKEHAPQLDLPLLPAVKVKEMEKVYSEEDLTIGMVKMFNRCDMFGTSNINCREFITNYIQSINESKHLYFFAKMEEVLTDQQAKLSSREYKFVTTTNSQNEEVVGVYRYMK